MSFLNPSGLRLIRGTVMGQVEVPLGSGKRGAPDGIIPKVCPVKREELIGENRQGEQSESKYMITPWGQKRHSTLQLVDQLIDLLKHQSTGIKVKTTREFIKTLEKTSPWFIHNSSLTIPDWD